MAPQTGIIRLAFLQTFYGDPQVILLYAVLRYVRQQLPILWDNLKLSTVTFALGDIGNTNFLASDILGFPPGSVEAGQIVAINRALWIQNQLYDQQGSDIFGDLPNTQSAVRKVPESSLAASLSANIVQLYAEVPVLTLLKNVMQVLRAIRSDYRVGVSGFTGSTAQRDDWVRDLELIQTKLFNELKQPHDQPSIQQLAEQLNAWEKSVREKNKLVTDEIRRLEIISAIVEQLPFLFVGGAVASGFGAWVGEISGGSRLLMVLSEGVTITVFNALTAPSATRPTTPAGWAAQLGTNILLAGIGRVFQTLVPTNLGGGLASSRRILLTTAVQAGGAFAATTLVQSAIQSLEQKAAHQGGESSFTEMLTLNAIMNGLGLLFGAAVRVEPAGAPAGQTLALPTPKDLASQWKSRGVPIDEPAAQEWLDLVNRSNEFRDRYRQLAKAAREGKWTEADFENWRNEGVDLADDLGKKLPRLAKVLGSTHTPAEIENFVNTIRNWLKNLHYTDPVELRPEYIPELRQVGEGPTWIYDQPQPPARVSLLRKFFVDHATDRGYAVRDLPGAGGFEVTDAQGQILLQALRASPATARFLPPSLDAIARGARTEEGLARVRAQTSAPELAAQLAQAAAKFGANPIRRLLQTLARGDAPPSDLAFRGLSNFVKLGGDPRVAARAVTIAGDRTGAYATSLFEQMASWDISVVNGLEVLYQVRPRTTGEQIGVLLGDFPPDDVKAILRGINELAPHARQEGLRRIIGQLATEFRPPQRYRPQTVAASPTQIGARGTLDTAVDLLKQFPGKTVSFEVPGLTPLGAIRIEDIVIVDPATGERIIGFEVKEVTSAFLGPRAPKQLAADIARDAVARLHARDFGVRRGAYDTFKWRVRRFEIAADAAKRLQARGVNNPTLIQLDAEMRAMIRSGLQSTFDQAEVRNLPPDTQAEYRALFDQTMPFLEFDGSPAPPVATDPATGMTPTPPKAKPGETPAPTTPGGKQSRRVLAPKERVTRAEMLESVERRSQKNLLQSKEVNRP